jgi:hypothetical protein
VRLARRTLIFTVGLFLVLALNGCGGGSGGAAAPVASKTVEWQADGNGYVQFFTDDPKSGMVTAYGTIMARPIRHRCRQ